MKTKSMNGAASTATTTTTLDDIRVIEMRAGSGGIRGIGFRNGRLVAFASDDYHVARTPDEVSVFAAPITLRRSLLWDIDLDGDAFEDGQTDEAMVWKWKRLVAAAIG